jgi:hypothetical protein
MERECVAVCVLMMLAGHLYFRSGIKYESYSSCRDENRGLLFVFSYREGEEKKKPIKYPYQKPPYESVRLTLSPL